MYKIGYVSLSVATDKDYMSILKDTYENVHNIEQEHVMGKIKNDLDVVIIQDDDNQYIGNVCEMIIHLKKSFSTLVWIVSEHLTKANRCVYPRLGADGIAGSECEPAELVQLISNALKRHRNMSDFSSVQSTQISKKHHLKEEANLKLVPSNFSVTIDNKEIDLTKLEYLTMEYLYQNIGRAVSYEKIYQNVWKDNVGERKYRVSNLIFHLRKKIEKDEKSPKYIKTVRSKGYMLVV
ncbi:winged helix-turn-helix domain-containing protein [Candidatus Enterococcus ikei]|uniref:Winged helix-turn-helix domain-containing protein n=1 Tax=Candidatus Enterococcus ikei TaxID=2815326 RepID=A0ABS3H0X1_9ENTE|nr:winged helix-turn-helix domain-containing protein [Enterococcus sp. DIV0869a]MBO0441178.1 winged helix-turn-helix domain-containing protein [Enterococcus sp. DIV0869a]